MGNNGNNIRKPLSSDLDYSYGLGKIRNEVLSDYAYIYQSYLILDVHHGVGILKEVWVDIQLYYRTISQLLQ